MKVQRGYLLLSAQKGLLENIFPNLRAVCIGLNDNLIQTHFYYDISISEGEREMCNRTINHIIKEFSTVPYNTYLFEFEMPIIRIDYPKKMPLVGDWAFYRKEDTSRYID